MPPAARDRVLQVLAAVFGIVTVTGMVSSLRRLGDVGTRGHELDNFGGWLAVLWLVLLLALLWRLVHQLRGMRRLLASREEQIEAAGATSHDWLWEATPDLVATYCSPGVAEILGRTPSEVVGRPFHEFLVPDDQPRVQAVLARALEQKQGWDDVELRWLHANGHPVSLQGSAAPIFDERRNLVGYRGTRRRTPADAVAQKRLAMITDRVRDALEHGSITIALQPIIGLTTGNLAGVEALARFPDNGRPDVWFAEAHEVGHGADLELLAVRRALAVLAGLPEQVFLSVNASPSLITDARLAALLGDPSVPLHRIVLELTEHIPVDRYGDIISALLPLRERGLRLAIDDAGAGYASFAHVLKLRPDTIKLDRSLVADIDADPARRAFVTAIVLLALELDATVTAEGIENVRELEAVAALGVDHGQGYLLAKPTTEPDHWRAWQGASWQARATMTGDAAEKPDLQEPSPKPADARP